MDTWLPRCLLLPSVDFEELNVVVVLFALMISTGESEVEDEMVAGGDKGGDVSQKQKSDESAHCSRE